MSLGSKLKKGLKWTTLSSIIVGVIQISQITILTRYLIPEDFGLMAIVSVIIGFCAIFQDAGLSAIIIYKRDISQKQLSSLYWFNLIIGLFLTFIIYNFSYIFAWLYSDERIIFLIQVMSFSFIITSFGSQHKVILQKNFNFELLGKVEVVSYLSSFIIAVILVLNEYGVMSLVIAALCRVTIETGCLLIVGSKYYFPSIHMSKRDLLPILSFGGFQLLEKVINYFNSQLDTFLIGKLLGFEVLGLYNVAKNLASKPAQVINPILTKLAFPFMTEFQDDNRKLGLIYNKIIRTLCYINFPIYIGIFFVSDWLITLFFGSAWLDASIILKMLSIYYLFRSIGNPIGSLQLAKGRVDLGFYWNLTLFILTPIFIFTGSFWGMTGICLSLTAFMILLIYPNWKYLVRKLCDLEWTVYITSITKPLFLSIVPAFIFSLISYLSEPIYLILCLSFYLVLLYFLESDFKNLFHRRLKVNGDLL